MSYKANVKLGAVPVQVEADNLKDLIKQASFFSEVPAECTCGSTDLVPRHRKHEDNDFYEIFCKACEQTLGLGQHRTGGTLFVKNGDGWKPPYRRNNEE